MNTFTILGSILSLVAIALACGWLRRNARDYGICLENVGEGRYEDGNKSYLVDAAFSTRFLLAKRGTDADHVDVGDASTEPLGVVTDEAAAAEDRVNVALLGKAAGTQIMVGSEVMTYNDDVYAAASGKVQDKPTGAGTYWKVGRALTACGGDGQELAVEPCFPVKIVIDTVAALTSAAITGTLTGTVNGAMVDIAADTPACAGGSSPTAGNVDTAINTAVATIVTGTNEQLKELLTAMNELQVDVAALRANIVALQANGAVAV